MNASTETTTPPAPPATLRMRLADIDARARALPAAARALPAAARARARARARAMITRLRVALDLPSRSEIAELTARLEELDRRFGQLADARLATPVRSTLASAGEAAPVEPAAAEAAPVEPVTATAAAEPVIEAEDGDTAAESADGDTAADGAGGPKLSRKERRRQGGVEERPALTVRVAEPPPRPARYAELARQGLSAWPEAVWSRPVPGDRALIVVPTYNERDNVREVAARFQEALPRADLLFVDDNSPDGTGALLDEIAAAAPRVHVLHRAGKLGLGTAYLDGFRWGLARGYAYLFEMDADFSHDPRYLPGMLALAEAGADVVVGSRYVDGGGTENWGVGRKVLSRGGSLYARTVLGIAIRDVTAGFICYRRARSRRSTSTRSSPTATASRSR